MAEEFQATAEICGGGGGAWWNSPRSVISPSDHFLSPCFGSRLTCMDNNNNNDVVFGQNKLMQREADSDSGGSTVTMDSTLQMINLGFPSDWNHQTLIQEDQGFLSTTSPYLINHCSSSSSSSSSSNLLRSFYESEQTPYNDSQQLSWVNKMNPNQAFGLLNNFSNDTNSNPFWSSLSTPNFNNNAINSFVTSQNIITPRLEDKTKNLKTRGNGCESVKRSGKDNESSAKKARVATPSTLPTFKVRKENLRDQITSLQQLVSPFGKTDTASVLQEAIEYIKFLHDQVTVLSTPYMKQGSSIHQQQQICGKSKNQDGEENQELRRHGLCLVPISSTFPVTNETTADFWTPTFGGNTFR